MIMLFMFILFHSNGQLHQNLEICSIGKIFPTFLQMKCTYLDGIKNVPHEEHLH